MDGFRERLADLSRTERLIVAVIGGILLLSCCSSIARMISSNREDAAVEEFAPAETGPTDTLEPVESAPSAETVTTARGIFSIPGTATLDGRDTGTTDAVTIMSINVWDGVPPHLVVCKLDHEEQVDLLAAQWNDEESKTYFQVKSGSCEGWVSEAFVSQD